MKRSSWGFVIVGLLLALLVVVFLAPRASSSPDGLERVAASHGLDADATASPVEGGPLADYELDGVSNPGLSIGVAGAIGVVVAFAATAAVGTLVTAHRRRTAT